MLHFHTRAELFPNFSEWHIFNLFCHNEACREVQFCFCGFESIQLQNTGIGLFVLAYLFNALRKGTTDSNRSEMMQHHAVGWGTWGVLMLAMMTASGQLNAGNLFMWQAIVFLIIAAAFYLVKDGNSVTSQA